MKEITLEIIKRDKRTVPFHIGKIDDAIFRCLREVYPEAPNLKESAKRLASTVQSNLDRKTNAELLCFTVEEVQDEVERVLMIAGRWEAARAYILFRENKSKLRSLLPAELSQEELDALEAGDSYFPNEMAKFVGKRTYCRWQESLGRRETWEECVDRTVAFYRELAGDKLSEETYREIRLGILNMQSMPSMRLMQMAGEAVRQNGFTAYNCSYRRVDSIQSFAEIFFLLMAGTGVGFSVEQNFTQDLPKVRRRGNTVDIQRLIESSSLLEDTRQSLMLSLPGTLLKVADSAEGWADALKACLIFGYQGMDLQFDYSGIRLAGTRLKTKGGFASGYEALKKLITFVQLTLNRAQGRRLTSLECHDLCCMIGEITVVGGVRRSALISLSDISDNSMRDAKSGAWYKTTLYRKNANNSFCVEDKPDSVTFMGEWIALMKSGSGERGIFNRKAAQETSPKRRKSHYIEGTNPCSEISLLNCQTCNLTEIVVRSSDNEISLKEKVRLATIMGTVQSLVTNFPYVTNAWKINQEEERLLGVSLTGEMDNPEVLSEELLQELKEYAITVNQEYAALLGIPESAAITCVKPSGTVSVLVDSSAGMHTRWSPYYIRRVRIASNDPLFALCRDAGVPWTPEVGTTRENMNTAVLDFPVKAPIGARTRHDMTALESLEWWLKLKTNWAEHSVSFTCYVDEDEWLLVGTWVYKNFDKITGVSFLPKSDYIYDLAPYEDITREKYEALAAAFPKINYGKLARYEQGVDTTSPLSEPACANGSCELI